MDPIACMARINDAITSGDLGDARDAIADLTTWLERGGFACADTLPDRATIPAPLRRAIDALRSALAIRNHAIPRRALYPGLSLDGLAPIGVPWTAIVTSRGTIRPDRWPRNVARSEFVPTIARIANRKIPII